MKTEIKVRMGFLLLAFVAIFANPIFADDKNEIKKLGQLVAASIESNDFTEVDQKIDQDTLIERITKGLSIPTGDLAAFKKGLYSGLASGLFKKMFSGMQEQKKTSAFIGLLTIDNIVKPVVRVSYAEGGVNFLELELVKKNREFLIADMYIATNGRYLSDTLTDLAMVMAKQPSGWLANLINGESSRDNIFKIMQQALDLKQKGKFKEMYQVMQKLPEKIKQNEVVQLMLISAASTGMGDDAYRHELANFAKYNGDKPRYALTLVDYYYYEKQFDKALDATALALKRYDNDASLLTLKASVLIEAKRYPEAYESIEAALRKEVHYQEAYWAAVTASLYAKTYAKTVAWLQRLESEFDYDFRDNNFANQPIYEGFVASSECKKWLAAKVK